MKATIRFISLQNFKGCREKTYQFDGKNCTLFGANASGKTTIFDAIWWLLFNKDSLGSEKFSIRPLDKDGNRIDNVEIKVSAVFEIDGREKEFTKVQKQKWVKRRGRDLTELQGNENMYEIDGYPRTEKDYKSAISEIIGEDVFKMLTNPTYFPSLKWKEQRDILMRFVGNVSDYDLANGKEEFSSLLDELQKAPSTDGIMAKYQKMLKEWKSKQAEIPVRIDELEKSKVDIDVAELELGKKAVLELINSNKSKQESASAQYEEYQKLSDGILQLKFELSDMERNANAENAQKRREIENKISDKKFLVSQTERIIREKESDILICKGNIERFSKAIEGHRAEWKAENDRVFDENSLVCSYCGQEYPAEKKEHLRAEFESHKAQRLNEITCAGNDCKKIIDSDKEKLANFEKELPAHKKSLEMLLMAISDLEKQLSEIPSKVDVSQTEQYKAIEKQISEKETAMFKMNNSDDARQMLLSEEKELQDKLIAFEREIARAGQNFEIDERISELQEEQRAVAQKVADAEGMIYKLEQFIRYKMDCVSEEINNRFGGGIAVKLFELQINGGLKETCEITVDGVPYSSLNNGHRIVAGLQIIKGLSELYDVQMPIFVDNAESVNDYNIPNMYCQMILLKVSDDKEIRLEAEEKK